MGCTGSLITVRGIIGGGEGIGIFGSGVLEDGCFSTVSLILMSFGGSLTSSTISSS
ncbi:MAG: hypothetical protein VX191_02875 [Candidatus Thermoplasmatota archaeon]|nr:hypothetical protein [Candidatus Thermoplasmatota archaeon]MEE3200988.1 hypothetical protein [Candidatus Thermoplasmatota archaeon]MEE3303806.1 hypothetical protein [Candidatus Thermoplasmatota archaeon]